MPQTYILEFDNSGQNRQNIRVPGGKHLYLLRAEEVSRGELTVHNFQSGKTYTIPDGVTFFDPGISGGTNGVDVSLAFIGRSNNAVVRLEIEVCHRR